MRAAAGLRIDAAKAALLIVDVQERLWAAMAPDDRAMCLKNIRILVELARRLAIPVVLSEQYPKGLGRTVAEIDDLLSAPGIVLHRMEKVEFSCVAAPAFAPLADALRREQWIVAGMESHVCVYQTVRDLVARGAAVHVAADAVISRTRENRAIGLDLVAKAGGVVTSTEVVVFDALHRAGSEEFRAMSKLVR
jgi:nicotinamidase-related amidase